MGSPSSVGEGFYPLHRGFKVAGFDPFFTGWFYVTADTKIPRDWLDCRNALVRRNHEPW